MIHSASSQSLWEVSFALFEKLEWGYGQTPYAKIVITTGRGCGRPRSSIFCILLHDKTYEFDYVL